jgi:hypothetical protein
MKENVDKMVFSPLFEIWTLFVMWICETKILYCNRTLAFSRVGRGDVHYYMMLGDTIIIFTSSYPVPERGLKEIMVHDGNDHKLYNL